MSTVKSFQILCDILKKQNKTDTNKLKNDIIMNNINWDELIAIANREYLIPAVYYALKEKELLQFINDKQLQEYLLTIFKFNTHRNKEIIKQLLDLEKNLSTLNITPILLKGSVSLCENHYPELGIRSLTDIDILIENNKIQLSLNSLFNNGYNYILNEHTHSHKDSHHVDPICKIGMPASVEIHRTVLGNKATNFIKDPYNHAINCSHPNFQNVKILNPTYLAYHTFVHSELQDENHKFKRIDLRHLYDFTIIVDKHKNEIDWKQLLSQCTKTNCNLILYDYLYLIKMFFSVETPLTVETTNTIRHYKKAIKVLHYKATILENFYPLSAHIPKIIQTYSSKELKKKHNFNSFLGYLLAIVKNFVFHLKEMSSYLSR